jgi:pyridoxine 4-dehydrogenase
VEFIGREAHLQSAKTRKSQMSSTPSAAASGQFRIGGDLAVNRLGFGAMRVTGAGIWGEPRDRAESLRTLRRLPELQVDFIDTADSYGPFVSEDLIAEALAPYKGVAVATKGGLTRHGPGIWLPVGRPEYLRQCVLMSLRRLKVETIDLWQLHRIDPKTPRDDQFGAIAAMLKDGLIRHAGLSNVTVEDIEAARKVFPVATVQNRYNLVDRSSEAVLEYCTANNIGFIPWFPLAAGDLAKPGTALDAIVHKTGATPSQVALAWVLKRSPVMLPIPGTSQVAHLDENVAAAAIELSDADFQALDAQAKAAA